MDSRNEPKELTSDPPLPPVDTTKDVESGRQSDTSDRPEKPSKDISAAEEEDETKYPSMAKAIPVLISLTLAVFIVGLDRTIVSTAIPQITNEFNSIGDIGWYTSAYMMTQCSLQLMSGRIYTFASPKWSFVVSVLIFELGSLICAVAPNSATLIVGRAFAGAGSAGMFTGSIVVMVYVLPLRKRPLFQGIMGALAMVAMLAGPLIGGAFTTDVSWRWCFWINLPIGAIVLGLLFIFIQVPDHEDSRGASGEKLTWREKIGRLDLIGTAFFLPGTVCLLLALQWGGSTYSWSNARIIVLIIVFGLCMIAFIAVQIWKQENATVPPRIIKYRSVWSTTFFAFCTMADVSIISAYMPTWFQAIQNVNAIESGVRMLPSFIGSMVSGVLSGVLTNVIGYYTPVLIAGSCILSVGTGLLTTFTVNTPSSHWIGYQALYGLGIGLGQMQAGMAAQVVLPKKDVPTGVSLKFLGQSLGGAIFASVGQNVLSNKLVTGLSGIAGLDAEQIVNTGATDLRNIVAPDELDTVLTVYNGALISTFKVGLALGCVSIVGALLTEWKSVKGVKKGGK